LPADIVSRLDLPPFKRARVWSETPFGGRKSKESIPMGRGTKFKPEEIIAKLREAGVELARGKKIPEVCKQISVTEQTYYRWKKEYGGLRMDQAKRLKELEKENARLKRLLADAELDKAILKEAVSGNF
jgi:putative transposase